MQKPCAYNLRLAVGPIGTAHKTHSMPAGVYATDGRSVCLSVRLIRPAAGAAGLLLWARQAAALAVADSWRCHLSVRSLTWVGEHTLVCFRSL